MSLAPPADPVLEAVLRAREPGELLRGLRQAWESEAGEACPLEDVELSRVHYKPFARARLVVRGRLGPAPGSGKVRRQPFSLQIYSRTDQARRRRRSYLARPSLLPSYGPPSFVVPEWHAVGFSLPNGRYLRNLAKFLDTERTRAWLRLKGQPKLAAHYDADELEFVRYVPRKRALLRLPAAADGSCGGAYIKLYTAAEFEIAARNLGKVAKRARKSSLGFAAPRRLASGRKKRAVVMAELPGEQLTRFFAGHDDALMRAAGSALAGLHGSTVRTRARWTPRAELDAVRRAVDDLCAALPALQGTAGELLRRLQARLPEAEAYRPVPIHANLFGDQILADGNDLAIVDWDDLCLGDPAFDVGRLIAHIRYENRELDQASRESAAAFLDGHAERHGPPLPAARLSWHVAAALALRAKISALRPLAPDWPDRLERAFVEAHDALDHPEDAARGIFRA
ncbi:MAG: phosphotransferase [Planctomycetes bacterium]|nr:phosphotransferase [Planctomycetota bacterium]MBL7007487.1 phosphotransferase [Planctomycetota bacterium]